MTTTDTNGGELTENGIAQLQARLAHLDERQSLAADQLADAGPVTSILIDAELDAIDAEIDRIEVHLEAHGVEID